MITQARVIELLERHGRDDVKIVRSTVIYDPSERTSTSSTVKIRVHATDVLPAGRGRAPAPMGTGERDAMIYVGPVEVDSGRDVEIKIGDLVEVGDATWAIVDPKSWKHNGILLVWECAVER